MLRIATSLVAIAVVVALVVWQRHRFADLGAALGQANWTWIGLAVAAQAASIAALARQQRQLLAVDGHRVPIASVLATTYAGGAISQSLPVVGKAGAALYTYRRFSAHGVRPAIVGWTVAMSAVYSTVMFVAISAVGAIVTGVYSAAIAGAISIATVVLPIVALLSALNHGQVRRSAERIVDGLIRRARTVTGHPRAGAEVAVRSAIDTVVSLRLGQWGSMKVAMWSAINFAATIACLALSILAVGGDIPWNAIILVWAAGFGTSFLGLTPGGIGVVELALSASLISAGLPSATAIAAVLVYRGISMWLVMAVGGVTLVVTRQRPS